MPVQLQAKTQELVDTLLYAEENAKRNEALKTIIASPDKDQVEKYILERLVSETDRWRRTWSFSVLAQIGLTDGKKMVLDHTIDPPESDPWARHFALLNAGTLVPSRRNKSSTRTKDTEVLPKATALRLLLADDQDQYAYELLTMLGDMNVPDARWAAARALRNRSDIAMKPLRDHVEGQFIQSLVKIASDQNIYLDTRWEVIQTLASFVHRRREVTSQLGDLLVREKDPIIRRYYLDALRKLKQPKEAQVALLKAVEDSDAQIRLDAANARQRICGRRKERPTTLAPRPRMRKRYRPAGGRSASRRSRPCSKGNS